MLCRIQIFLFEINFRISVREDNDDSSAYDGCCRNTECPRVGR